jgi:nucleotide-binding universal stress UspA family protein
MCTDAAAVRPCDAASASTRGGEAVHQRTQKIVVGVDGSARCREAVRWAVQQGRGTNAVVQLVHAWHLPADDAVSTRERLPAAVKRTPEAATALGLVYDEELQAAREREQAVRDQAEHKSVWLLGRIRDAAIADARDRERVRIVALEGDARRTLVRESADADLLVVGSHRAAPVSATVLGSVSLYCTLHARCPVVVLPKTGARRSATGPEQALRSA